MYDFQDATFTRSDGDGACKSCSFVAVPGHSPKTTTFDVTPQEICFFNFEPHRTYELSLKLKNKTKEAQFVQITSPQSRLLELRPPRQQGTTTKIAPGLSVTYTVLFTPEDNLDYSYDLLVTTRQEKFTIPVHAVASRGELTLPKSFTVTRCPVKGTTETTFFLRNNGKNDCHWRADASEPFKVTPLSGVVPSNGGVLPLTVSFAPSMMQQYRSVIFFHLGPEEEVTQQLPIFGDAIEVAVALEQNMVEFPNTFVTLENQAVVCVRNDSDYTVNFLWKSEQTDAEEQLVMDSQVSKLSGDMRAAMLSSSLCDASQTRLLDERLKVLSKEGRIFDDDVFTIEPVRGVIYAKGRKEFIVTFNPQLATGYFTTAYLDISGRMRRLPLQIKGTGIAPQCELEYSHLDIGDVFLGALHEYEVAIINKSCIEARYTVLSQNTLMGRKFTFFPSEGVLAPGEQEMLRIQLQSDIIGIIFETFSIHLHGSLDCLTLRFRGRVTGPSLEFDVEELDFGSVSYDFFHSRSVQMKNIGKIPIRFFLRIPEISAPHATVTVSPSEGLILPEEQEEICVNLFSSVVGNCETKLLVDVDGIGEGVDFLPIKAVCLVPKLQLASDQLHYGTCFLGHEYSMNLEVVNKTALLGKYNVVLMNEGSVLESGFIITIDYGEGEELFKTIEARGKSVVQVKLTPLVVGSLCMTFYVRVLGSSEPPLPVLLTATVRGPTVFVEPKSLSFGVLTLLETEEKNFVLNNTSPIPAFFSASVMANAGRKGCSVFSVDPLEGEIPPYSNKTVKVTACLNDARIFSEKLQVIVRHAENNAHVILLTAQGKGYALVPVGLSKEINFGDVFTVTQVEKTLVFANKGQRDVDVLWSSNCGPRPKVGGRSVIFTIHPETAVISSGSLCTFTIQAFAEEVCNISEEFVLKDKREFKQIFSTIVSGNFIKPMITYSTKKILFDYIYGVDGNEYSSFMVKTFSMKNETTQPLQVILKCIETPSGGSTPFALVGPSIFSLASGETQIVGLNCDPFYRGDSIAHIAKGRLLVSLANHPFKEYIGIIANLAFPTIRIEPEGRQINFGSILVDTEGRYQLTLINMSSSVAAEFFWTLQSLDPHGDLSNKSETAQKQFDFVPFRGTIQPGGQCIVEAVFYGTRGRHEAIATCKLKGGPSYTVNLIGWSDVSVQIDCTEIVFGVMHYKAKAKKKISIFSPLRVAVPFTVDVSSLKQPGSVKVKPMKGMVTNRVMLTVTFSPVIPDEIVETFFVQVGHLDPQPITVRGLGQTYSVMVTSSDKYVALNRVEDATFLRCLEELKDGEWIPYCRKTGYTAELPDVDLAVLEAERLAYCRSIIAAESASVMCLTPLTHQFFAADNKNEKPTLILSRYVVNFGHMVWHETRTVKLQLINTSIYPTNINVVKQDIDVGTTISVTPRKIPSITQFSKTEISLSLSSSDTEHVVSGANNFQLFLDIHKGPRIVFDIRCFVATPLMTSCESSLNFGDIPLGRIKKMQLHFCNNEVVPCTWSLSLIESKRKSLQVTDTGTENIVNTQTRNFNKQQFKVNKDRGVLPSHSCMTIQVSFISYFLGTAKAKLRFRYASNPEEHIVPLMGNVVRVGVELSPSPLVFPPSFPYQTVRHSFCITNNEDYPLEVFFLHTDEKHQVETNILQRALKMQREQNIESSELYLPVREAGGSLPESLLNTIFGEQQLFESHLEAKYPNGIEERLTEKRVASRASSKRAVSPRLHSASQTTIAQRQDIKSLMEKSELSQTSVPQLVILTGPSYSGKTTQTEILLRKLNLVQLDLDAMVRAEAEFDTAEGEHIRTILSERKENTASSCHEDAADGTNIYSHEKKLVESRVVRILYTLLTRNLSKINPSVDVLMDDIKSILTDDREEVLFAIERAVTLSRRKLTVISIGISEADSGLRRNLETQEKCRDALEEATTIPLTEKEYEELDDEERDKYNCRLLHYNKCKRILDKATNEVLRYSAELKTQRLTVQEVVDAEMAAQEEQELLIRASQKKKKQPIEVRPKIQWSVLSELDQFKQLYMLLRRLKDIKLFLIKGEDSKEKLTMSIIESVFAPLLAYDFTKSLAESTAEDQTPKRKLFSPSLYYPSEYELITAESLASRCFPSMDQLRLFSIVQREVVVKKPQKGVPAQFTSAFEEVSRWFVPPRSSAEVTAVFCGEKLGEFTAPLVFGITGTSQVITLPVVAQIAYPEVCRDEKSIFTTIKPRIFAGRQQSRVFVMSKRTYDFGPLIIPCDLNNTSLSLRKGKVAGDIAVGKNSLTFSKEIGAYDTLTFTNIGIFPADVCLTFGKEKDNTFSVTPNKFTLPVGQKMTVVLRAAPETVGEVSSMLVMTVRDNPTPWFVYVSCIGTRPAVTLDGKKEFLLQYGRCLMTRNVEKVITIANVSLVSTRWHISGIDKLPTEFELSSTGGMLEVNGVCPLKVCFKPTRPGVHNVVLKLDVTDAEDTLFESLPVTIKAEAHDAVIEWSRAVDFKLMHVGDTKKETIRILNKSPYDVAYRLRLPKALQTLITLSPNEGLLRGLVGFKDASCVTVDVIAHLDREGEIPPGLGMIEASFFDPVANELLYPLQTIPVSGEAWYNRFTIKPSCIDFGSCIMNQKKQSTFELRNTGHFLCNFRLFNYKDTPAVFQQEEEEGNGKKHRRHMKVDHAFQLGAFSVTPSSGCVAVGESVIFQVSTVQTANSKNEEILGIYVDHCDREIETKGVPFELVALPTIPGIVADLTSNVDVETVFEEQQIVANFFGRSEALRAFARESQTFSFGTVLLGSRVEERFRIANSSPLFCLVKVQLLSKSAVDVKEKEKEKDRKEKECLLVLDCFHLSFEGEMASSNTFNLPPFESRFVTVAFSPSTLSTFNAILDAVVVGATSPKTRALRFELTGKGILPKLEYTFPPQLRLPFAITTPVPPKKGSKGKGKDSRKVVVPYFAAVEPAMNGSTTDLIQLPLTVVGATSSRELTVRNIGNVDAHIRLTAPNDCPCDIKLSKLREEIFLPVGASETFSFTFAPSVVTKHRVLFRVSVRENPYEDRDFWVVTESYFDSITFDNIDSWSENQLTLGYWYVSQLKEHVVTLCNNSPHAIRFNLNCPSASLKCNPTVGHVAAGASKPLTFSLFSETTLGESVQCTLQVTSIESMENGEWDNSMKKAKWVIFPSSSSSENAEAAITSPLSETDVKQNRCKVYDAVPEPPHNVTKDLVLQKTLLVSYVCEPTLYKVTLPMNGDVEPHDLTFPLTKIFQRRSTTLRVTNMGHNILPFFFELSKVNGGMNAGNRDDFDVFTVEPAAGEVQPFKYCDVSVTFAPRYAESVAQTLVGRFPYSERSTLSFLLQGTAECPFVHFNVPPCDYLATRIEGEAGYNLDPGTIPIIFRACGLQSRSVVTFKVINPTATTYRFEWISDPLSQLILPFRCLTPSGSITAGKQYEMAFDYTATSIGIRESKWTFFISGHMSVPFLLVGRGEEPNVSFNLSKVNFCGVTVGSKNERIVLLENKEDISFSFFFDRTFFEGENSCITVKPTSGVVSANSSLPITVAFAPKEEICINARIICRVKRLSDPLTINIKGEGLRIHSLLTIEEGDSDSVAEPIIVPPSQPFFFNLGRVQVDTVLIKRLVLSNEGQCSMDFVVVTPGHKFIEISPLSGTLGPKQRAVMMLVYTPKEEETLRKFKIQCRVEKTIFYTIVLKAISYIPKIQFNFTKFDFGPCFVLEFSSGTVANTMLKMINGETKETVSLDCTLSTDNIFDLDAHSFLLSPGETRNLKISFSPREVGVFSTELKIVFNGNYPFFIPLSGEGIIPHIDVPVRFLKLGSARIGERRSGELRLECRSHATTPVSLANTVDAFLREKGVSFSPNDSFVMRPREVRTINVYFEPRVRMPEFQREVRMLVCGREMPLAIISGTCEDAEVHLDIRNILFDDVVVGSSVSRRVVIMNSGDISQRFKWDASALGNSEIKVTPLSGFLRSHAEQVCEVVYAPKKPKTSFRCVFTVEFDSAPPLSVNVEAHGVGRPKASTIMTFSCEAKSSATKTVPIENPTDVLWTVKPTIDNRLWTAPKTFNVNPKSIAMLSVTYAPLFVSRDKDTGTLFIPFPNGSAQSIQLEGIAVHSIEKNAIREKHVEAGVSHKETFELQNWTSQALRFYSSINWTPEPEKGIVSVKLPVSIDVPAKQTKECSVVICSLKDGSLRGTVEFRCIEREDYTQTFDIALLVVPKTVSSKTELITAVRTSAIYRMPITNPFEKNAVVTTKVENGSDVIFVEPSITIPRKSTADVIIRFFPLLHKEYPVATVTVSGPELGVTSCKLNLRSTPPAPENAIRISCCLGKSVVFPLSFTHYSKTGCEFAVRLPSKTTYFAKVGSASNIKMPGTTKPEGHPVSIDIQYEPTSMGDIKDVIEVVSLQAGTYIFPILASCLPPEPQGPFILRAGQTTVIPFKNIFNDAITFTFVTDSPSFMLPKATENIAAKKTINISVTYKHEEDRQALQTSRLTVSCVYKGETLQWVYYLKHVVPEDMFQTLSTPRKKIL